MSTGENWSSTGESVEPFDYFQLATGVFVASSNWQLMKLVYNWHILCSTGNWQLATGNWWNRNPQLIPESFPVDLVVNPSPGNLVISR